jgi:hypothetical protein
MSEGLQSQRSTTALRLGTAALIAAVVAAVLIGAVSRVSDMRPAFCATPDELAEVMPGLRLHGLPLLNVGGDVRSNFLASMLYSQHGLGDTGFYHLARLVLGGIGAAISERNLWLFQAATNGLLMAAAAWLMWAMTRSRVTVAAVIVIMAVAPFYVFTSQSGWGGRLTFVPLVQALVLLVAWAARRREGLGLHLLLAGLTCVLMLTDGFFFIAVVLTFLLVTQDGSLANRLRVLLRQRVFWAVAAGALAGSVIGITLAIVAAQRGTRLTLYRHAFLHAANRGVAPTVEVVSAWIQTFQWYFPGTSYFWVVLSAWLLAVWRARVNPIAATLAVWWLIVGMTLVSYTAGLTDPGQPPLILGWANGPYHQALPSYLLIAWAAGYLMQRRTVVVRIAGALLVLGVAAPLAAQTVSGSAAPVRSLREGDYVLRLSQCQAVKAASYYVRKHGTPKSTVFHLSSDVFLGYFGEFYYGLSYSGNHRTGERNQLLDFGGQVLGRKVAPEAFARAYGLPYFDYYVQFLPDIDPFSVAAVARLGAAGAKPVFEVREDGSAIGRVWSFHRGEVESLEFTEAARRWNEFATLDGLIQQPLAGTTYHFGYSWTVP